MKTAQLKTGAVVAQASSPARVPTGASPVGPNANHDGWRDSGSRDGLPHYSVAAWAVATVLLVIVTPHHTNGQLPQEAAPSSEQKQPIGRPGSTAPSGQSSVAFKASFNKLAATLQGMFAAKSPMTIGADGSVECSLPVPGVTNYQSRFRLQPSDLRELERILEQTDWLTRPLPDKGRAGVTDATYVNVAVTRHGQERAVRFDLQSPEPYRSLGVFIWRLRRQEQLQAELIATPARERRTGCAHLVQALDQSRNTNATAWDLPLDFHRFVPAMGDMLTSPHDRDGEELIAAARLMAALKIESQRPNLEKLARHSFRDREPAVRLDDARVAALRALRDLGSSSSVATLAALAQDRSSWVRGAVAEALQTVPPDQAIPILTNMTANTRPAAWTLIHLGPPAVPAIIGILQLNEHDHKESGPYRVTREYYEHWDEIPKPVDPRVLRAIQQRVELGLADDYALKLLEKAGQPFKPVNARRTLEQFLSGVAAGDEQELVKVGRIHFRWNAPGEFLTQAKAGRLKVDRCFAERSTAWAVVADTQDAKRNYFVWLNQESGRIWEIAAARLMTEEQADRELKRTLKDHPSATDHLE